MSREAMLGRVRSALGRTPGQTPPEPPPVRLAIPNIDPEKRVRLFAEKFEALAGSATRVPDAHAARNWVETFLGGRTAVASNARFLQDCGIPTLNGVETNFTDRAALRQACTHTNVGITSADFALAETGTLVMIASPQEARLISLLPPIHLAVFPVSALLTGLDELFTVLPLPAEQTSSMVLITGPSRTADIEQILVRGVHGPGEIFALIVG